MCSPLLNTVENTCIEMRNNKHHRQCVGLSSIQGGGGGGGLGSSVVERATLGQEVPGSIFAVAVRSLLVGSVSV